MSNGDVEVRGWLFGSGTQGQGLGCVINFKKHHFWELTGTTQWIRLPKESVLVSLTAEEKEL